MRKSILIIGKIPPPIGGVTMHTYRLYVNLKSKYKNVKLIQPKPMNLFKILLFSFFYKNILIESKSFAKKSILFYFILKKIFGKNIINVFHSLRDEPIKYKKVLKYSDYIIAVNSEIKRRLNGIEKNKKILVYSPFIPPTDEEKRFFKPFKYEKSTNEKIIVFNAYKIIFENNKDLYGLDTIIEFFSEISKKSKKYTLFLCIPQFDEKSQKYLNRLLDEYSLEMDNIKLWVDNYSLIDIFKISDYFIRPTLSDGDALSIREANFFGVETIASDCVKRPKFVRVYSTEIIYSLISSFNDIENSKSKTKEKNYSNENFKKWLKIII